MSTVAETPFPTSFPSPTFSYDVHIYFNEKDPKDVESASQLREEIIEKFGHLQDLRVYKLHEKPIGPHPIDSYPGFSFTERRTEDLLCSNIPIDESSGFERYPPDIDNVQPHYHVVQSRQSPP
ncbi:hypothetical protein NQZ79_g8877 [Umbelopsis isabellina]|nr:hypothetical protein NQZ79_g8877 [Umbelopsis isabellina]